MSLDVLQVMFTCERYRGDFPRGMPMKACLRRQLDRQEGAKPGQLGPPRRPFCAETCPLGAQHRAAARDAGVPLEACPACGSALVGADAQPCATCAARRLDAGKDVPRGELPAAAAPSSRIWSGEVPDVPIAAPGAKRRPDPVLPRQHHPSTPAPRAPVNPEEPAAPAKEEAMAKTVCGNCGSPSKHRGTCKGGPRVAAKGKPVEVPVTRKPAVTLAAAPAEKRPVAARRTKAAEEPDFGYLATETADALDDALRRIDATRAAILAEVERRAAQLDRLRERLRAPEAA